MINMVNNKIDRDEVQGQRLIGIVYLIELETNSSSKLYPAVSASFRQQLNYNKTYYNQNYNKNYYQIQSSSSFFDRLFFFSIFVHKCCSDIALYTQKKQSSTCTGILRNLWFLQQKIFLFFIIIILLLFFFFLY